MFRVFFSHFSHVFCFYLYSTADGNKSQTTTWDVNYKTLVNHVGYLKTISTGDHRTSELPNHQRYVCTTKNILHAVFFQKPTSGHPKFLEARQIYPDTQCTPLKFNIAPKNRPSQKETHLPTTIFQGLC